MFSLIDLNIKFSIVYRLETSEVVPEYKSTDDCLVLAPTNSRSNSINIFHDILSQEIFFPEVITLSLAITALHLSSVLVVPLRVIQK